MFVTRAVVIQFKDVRFVVFKVILIQNLIKHKFGPVTLSVAFML